jgi:SET domain-containing protein
VDIAKDLFQDVAEFNLQIRQGRWGYGVFALANIPRGTLIGEYLGRLIPLDTAHPRDARYTYTIEGRTESDSQQYGNVSRCFLPSHFHQSHPLSSNVPKSTQ